MPGQDFERSIVHAFNNYFESRKIKALAYRRYQMRYQPQSFDVLVDSRMNELYLALECKSIDTQSVDKIYFKKHFQWPKGVCQVEIESRWAELTGRNAYLVVELRRGTKKRTTAFFVPWRTVWYAFNREHPAIEAEQVTWCPCIDKRGGKYLIDEEFMTELVELLDTPPREKRKVVPKKWSG